MSSTTLSSTDTADLQPPPPPPTKPRLNPLDFRNTDLVSRLLAATPPYLYNMPMVPNSYFFSEMLRSFVQAKTVDGNSTRNNLGYQRRGRKRPWTAHQSQYFDNAKTTSSCKRSELTMPKIGDLKALCEASTSQLEKPPQSTPISFDAPAPTQSPAQDILLPPPPPLWYPSMYPPPYGIDPLHFFIDLRVSGHIYDRKNGKDSSDTAADTQPTEAEQQNKDVFRQSRHASAFSVPVSSAGGGSKNVPMNLSNQVKNELKFDVKSMVYNKTGTSYVMRNVNSIYKEIKASKQKHIDSSSAVDINVDDDDDDDDDTAEDSEVKRAKHLKALFGLDLMVDYMKKKPTASTVINVNSDTSGTSASENESVGSPALDVVDVNDDSSCL